MYSGDLSQVQTSNLPLLGPLFGFADSTSYSGGGVVFGEGRVCLLDVLLMASAAVLLVWFPSPGASDPSLFLGHCSPYLRC